MVGRDYTGRQHKVAKWSCFRASTEAPATMQTDGWDTF